MPSNPNTVAPAQNGRGLLSTLPDVALVLDEMARVNFASAGTDGLLGSRPHSWNGRSALDQLHPDDVPCFVERLKRSSAGEANPTTALHVRVVAADQRWETVAAHGFVPVDIDGLVGTLVTLRDLAGRLTRDSAQDAASDRLFRPMEPFGDLVSSNLPRVGAHPNDRAYVVTELLPRLLNSSTAQGFTTAIIVMTLEPQDQADPSWPALVGDPIGQLANGLSDLLRPDDVMSRLEDTKLLIVCCGLTSATHGRRIARRLHATGHLDLIDPPRGQSLRLTTGFALASEGDEAADVLDHAASTDAVSNAGQLMSTVAA